VCSSNKSNKVLVFISLSSIFHRHLLVTSCHSLDLLTMRINSEHADYVIHSDVT